MKRRLLSALLALALVLALLPGAALAAEGGTGTESPGTGGTDPVTPPAEPVTKTESGLEYTLKDDDTWEVTGYKSGSKITIPDKLSDGKTVTGIKEEAFKGNAKITDVSIAGTVAVIGESAFENCAGLKTVTIQSAEPIEKIEKNAFLLCENLNSFVGSVKVIGESAFQASGLTSVVISKGLEQIEKNVFAACGKLTQVYLYGTEELTEPDIGVDVLAGTALRYLHVNGDFDEAAAKKLLSSIPANRNAVLHKGITAATSTDATCTKDGTLKVVVKCLDGSCSFKTLNLTFPKTGHVTVPVSGKDPTCTEKGLEAGTRCTRCQLVTQRVIPAKGHTWDEGTLVKDDSYQAPTCTKTGKGTFTYHCTVAGCTGTKEEKNVEIPMIPHSYEYGVADTEEKWVELAAPDCTKAKTPDKGEESNPEGGKTPGGDDDTTGGSATGGITETPGTGNTTTTYDPEKGEGLRVKVRVCSVCKTEETLSKEIRDKLIENPNNPDLSDYVTETIPAGDAHVPDQLVNVKTGDFNCEEGGKNLTVIYTCSKCGEKYEETGVELKAGTHIPAEDLPAEDKIPADLKKDIKAASCTEAGKEARTCAVCGKVYLADIKALGHDYSEPKDTVTKEPTCTEPGVKSIGYAVCQREGCDASKCKKEEEISPAGHHYDSEPEVEITKEATCTEPGAKTTSGTCTKCGGDVAVSETIPATGHTPQETFESKITKAATCTEPGVETVTYLCAVCKEVIRDVEFEITPQGHNFVNQVCTKCGAKQSDVVNPPASGDEDDKPGGGDSSGGQDGNNPVTPTPTTYAVNLIRTTNGSISASVSRAAAGERVRVTVTPYVNYELDYLRVTRRDGGTVSLSGQGDGQYTFEMPRSEVDIYAAFIRPASYTPAPAYRPSTPAPSSIVLPTVQTVPRAAAGSGQLFYDIPSAHWASGEIAWAYQRGYMGGTSSGNFSPDGTITYQQMWMVLARMTGSRPANMEAARLWAQENGFAEGANPGVAITRQQLVTALYRTAVLLGRTPVPSGNLAKYRDSATVSAAARNAFNWAVSSGIISGTADGRLDPNGTTTRAQFAVILYRFYQRI